MEKIINYIVGIIVLTNLYYLNNLIGIPRDVLIILTLLISLFYFIRNWSNKMRSLLGVKFTLSLFLLSLILFSLNSLVFEYEFYPNDMLRIFLYTFYFGWTFSLYKDNKEHFQKYLIRLLEWILIIVIIMTCFEYFLYDSFKILISEEFIDLGNDRRIALTFMDPNSCSAALIVFLLIYINLNGIKFKSMIYLLITILIINLTGSRMGLILLIISFFPLIKPLIQKANFVKIIVGLGFMTTIGLLLSLNSGFSTINENELSTSIFDRMFTEDQKSSRSTDQRIESIKNGIEASNFSNLILPPGNFNFRSKWEKVVDARHYPHSSFIYMLVEYGLYFIWPLIFVYLLYKKSKQINFKLLYLILLVELFFLPNAIYYSTFFLIFFYIEMQYEFSRNFTFLKE